jgi:hypothetical protein
VVKVERPARRATTCRRSRSAPPGRGREDRHRQRRRRGSHCMREGTVGVLLKSGQ